MAPENLKQLAEIRKRMKCSKEFQCAESGFKKLCRAKDVGLKRHLLWLEEMSALCDFSLQLAEKNYCGCPLRVYLTKSLKMAESNKADVV